jgi:mRNA-degrading endonuclease RelE of RelBE toxin-antitoxin system
LRSTSLESEPTAGWPANIRLTTRAQRDLDALDRDRAKKRRILDDIRRLAVGQLPPAAVKKLKGFDPPLWQADSGAFRIFHTWEQGTLWLRGILRKPEQQKRLRSLR